MTADGVGVLGDISQEAIERAVSGWLAERGTWEQVNWADIRKRALAEVEPREKPPVPEDDEWPFKPVVVSETELQRRRDMQDRLRAEFPSLRRISGTEGE